MKKILLGLATIGLVSAISFSACGGDPCSAKSKCSADPAVTAADIKTCQDTVAKMTTCKTEYDAQTSCFQTNQKCTSDNKSDGVATLAACKTQFDAYTKCVAAAVTDAGTKDGG